MLGHRPQPLGVVDKRLARFDLGLDGTLAAGERNHGDCRGRDLVLDDDPARMEFGAACSGRAAIG